MLVVKKVYEEKNSINKKSKFELYHLFGDIPNDLVAIDLKNTEVVVPSNKEFVFNPSKGSYNIEGIAIGNYLLVETVPREGFALVDKYPTR